MKSPCLFSILKIPPTLTLPELVLKNVTIFCCFNLTSNGLQWAAAKEKEFEFKKGYSNNLVVCRLKGSFYEAR